MEEITAKIKLCRGLEKNERRAVYGGITEGTVGKPGKTKAPDGGTPSPFQ